jgi:hypothetical protein
VRTMARAAVDVRSSGFPKSEFFTDATSLRTITLSCSVSEDEASIPYTLVRMGCTQAQGTRCNWSADYVKGVDLIQLTNKLLLEMFLPSPFIRKQ